MALRGKKPEAIQKRLKMFLFSPAGVGKTTAAIQMPNSYVIDCEKGAENYDKLIVASGSVVFQTTDMLDVVQEVKSLLTTRHDYRTLVIDPITTVYNDLLEKCEAKVGSDFGRHYGEANKTMKRLANLIMALDMNVIVTAHAKTLYGDNLTKLGETFDGWKQLDYWFDLVVELRKAGPTKRVGHVRKTRIETFVDGESFDWSYATIKEKYERFAGAGILDRTAQEVPLATADQVREIKDLLNIVRLPEGMVDKWFAKAGVDLWEDMPAEVIGKCIDHVKGRMAARNAEQTIDRSESQLVGV